MRKVNKNSITNTFILEKCNVKRNSYNIKLLNDIKERIENKKIVDHRAFTIVGEREKEIYRVLKNYDLLEYQLNSTLLADYYNLYCNLIAGTTEIIDEVYSLLKKKPTHDQLLNAIAFSFKRKRSIKHVQLFYKVETDEGWMKLPIHVFKNEKERELYKDKVKELKRNKKNIQQQAFEMATEVYDPEFNKIFYDELFDKLKY